MTWTYNDALVHIGDQFPDCEVLIEDGGGGYEVGVVENQNGVVVASFRLTFDLSQDTPLTIQQIDIAEPGRFCGVVTADESKRDPADSINGSTQAFARLTITSRSENPFPQARGLVGDYEVLVPLSLVDAKER